MAEGIRLRVLPAVLPQNIELGSNETHLLWRYVGQPDASWQNLIALSEITGPIQSITAGAGLTIDNTDPANPIISLA